MPHIKEHKERGAISKKQQHNSTGYHNVDMINEEHAKSEIVMNFMLFLSILDFFFHAQLCNNRCFLLVNSV